MVCPGGFGKAPGAGPILPVPQLAMPLPLVTRPHLQRVQSREGDVTGRDTVETGGRIKDAPAFTVEDLRVRERQLGPPPLRGPSSARWPIFSGFRASDRKRGLAKLRLDDGLLRGCSTRAGRQLQHCRALAIAQARD